MHFCAVVTTHYNVTFEFLMILICKQWTREYLVSRAGRHLTDRYWLLIRSIVLVVTLVKPLFCLIARTVQNYLKKNTHLCFFALSTTWWLSSNACRDVVPYFIYCFEFPFGSSSCIAHRVVEWSLITRCSIMKWINDIMQTLLFLR